MKKIFAYFIVGTFALGITSCKKYLDINTNPNSPTSTTPALVLPQALVGTASLVNSYDQNLGFPGGFFANVYGFGAYGATVTLNYGTGNFTGLFQTAYDNTEDYQYILTNTTDASLIFSNSIARIMKSYVFAKLVDNYNDVPYSQALTGATVLTPKYDSAPVIYQDLVVQLNTAIANITKGQAASSTTANVASSADPMFAGDMNRWKRFANSLKLRLLIKMAGVSSLNNFTAPQFAAFDNTIGVITEDATVNPGYLKQGGRVSPIYSSLAANETNTRTATSILPSRYAYAYYNGGKIQDAGRGSVVYRLYPNTATNQLGQESLASTVIPPANFTAFYTGTDFDTPGLGAVKGPAQGQVMMLLAEARFLKAEAIARGYISGNAQTEFEAGIVASFRYLYKNQTDVVDASKTTALSNALEDYKSNNPTTYLVNYSQATSLAQRLEAIITQKYIAFNLINMDEAFAEYRRTGYPTSSNSTADPIQSFASIQSRATSADKLITRLPYPQSEYNLNPANVPQNVNIFTAKVFWDVN